MNMDNVYNQFKKLQNGNDLRGVVIAVEGEAATLTPEMAGYAAAAFADFLRGNVADSSSPLRIGVGHDSRVTAKLMKDAICGGLSRQGAAVFDCGLITTPAMFFSTILPASGFDGAIMITASHLPFNRNGMKFFTKEGAIDKKQMAEVLNCAAKLAEADGWADMLKGPVKIHADEQAGKSAGDHALSSEDDISGLQYTSNKNVTQFDMKAVYSAHMRDYIRSEIKSAADKKASERPADASALPLAGLRGEDQKAVGDDADASARPLAGLRIAVDAGNGAAGFFATDILAPLGADISGSVFLDPDGTFPNHVPNPENKQAMEAARAAVLASEADLGVIFDCDGDRSAVVFEDGREANRNILIGLLSAIVAEEYPGSTVVTDSVTSDELADFLEGRLGLRHLRYRRGYKNVISKGIELNAAGVECRLAIETSGHGAFKENYFSDDGAYIAAKVIARLAVLRREGKRLEALIEGLGTPAESIEVRYHISGEDFADYAGRVLEEFEAFASEAPLFTVVKPNYEGVRVAFDDEEVKGWLLVRKSLHDPVLPMNVESKEAGGTRIILGRVEDFFSRFDRLSV